MSPEEDRTRDAVYSEPKHYQLSYSGLQSIISEGENCSNNFTCSHTEVDVAACRSLVCVVGLFLCTLMQYIGFMGVLFFYA